MLSYLEIILSKVFVLLALPEGRFAMKSEIKSLIKIFAAGCLWGTIGLLLGLAATALAYCFQGGYDCGKDRGDHFSDLFHHSVQQENDV